MATISKRKQRCSPSDADGDFQPPKVPVSIIAAPKRKQLRSSLNGALVELNDNGSQEPAPKRLKTKEKDNIGMIRIIPPDEVQIRQIQVAIIANPIPVDYKRLSERILSMPAEIQELIRVQCICGRANNVPFVQAFLSNRDIMLHSTQVYKAISEKEVVLTGKNFLREFGRLHPAVVQLAKKLKVVYITEDIIMTPGEWKKRLMSHDRHMATYQKYQHLHSAGLLKLEYCPGLPAAPIRARHKMYPMGEPRWGTERCAVMLACRKFVSVCELTIDLSSHVTYNGVDKDTLKADKWYGTRIAEHVHAAIGFDPRNDGWVSAKFKRGDNKLSKLTLVLSTAELSKDEVPEHTFAANQRLGGFRGPYIAPNWQWMRYHFREDTKKAHFNPKVHLPLTEFNIDKAAGVVSYKREGYQG